MGDADAARIKKRPWCVSVWMQGDGVRRISGWRIDKTDELIS